MIKYESSIEEFPGHVMLRKHLTFPEAMEFETAFAAAQEAKEDEDFARTNYDLMLWNAIRPCVAEWHLEGVDPDNPPATPRMASANLAAWLVGSVMEVYIGIQPDPNA